MLYSELEKLCRCAGVVLYRKKGLNLEFLLVETTQKRFQYSFPKGKRENDETTIETAIRETREETGLYDSCYTLNKNVYFIEYLKNQNLGYNKPHIIYYLAEMKEGDFELEPQDKKEIVSCNWFSPLEINNMTDKFTYQRRCILNKVIKNHFGKSLLEK
jgi:8-oxo-dGTP pyrophosphatase MutT (NUDIX family)